MFLFILAVGLAYEWNERGVGLGMNTTNRYSSPGLPDISALTTAKGRRGASARCEYFTALQTEGQ